ncbi:hypothetical protein [Lacinutrix sp. MEBiC02404]
MNKHSEFYINLPFFFVIAMGLISCKMQKKIIGENQLIKVTEIENTNEYIIIEGNSFKKATILKDTIKNDYTKFSSFIAYNYIPTKKNLKLIEQKIQTEFNGNKRKYFRQYRGFRTKEKDTIIEVGMLTKYGTKQFPKWKNKAFEYIEMHKKHKRIQFSGFLYFTDKGNLISSDSLSDKILTNLISF